MPRPDNHLGSDDQEPTTVTQAGSVNLNKADPIKADIGSDNVHKATSSVVARRPAEPVDIRLNEIVGMFIKRLETVIDRQTPTSDSPKASPLTSDDRYVQSLTRRYAEILSWWGQDPTASPSQETRGNSTAANRSHASQSGAEESETELTGPVDLTPRKREELELRRMGIINRLQNTPPVREEQESFLSKELAPFLIDAERHGFEDPIKRADLLLASLLQFPEVRRLLSWKLVAEVYKSLEPIINDESSAGDFLTILTLGDVLVQMSVEDYCFTLMCYDRVLERIQRELANPGEEKEKFLSFIDNLFNNAAASTGRVFQQTSLERMLDGENLVKLNRDCSQWLEIAVTAESATEPAFDYAKISRSDTEMFRRVAGWDTDLSHEKTIDLAKNLDALLRVPVFSGFAKPSGETDFSRVVLFHVEILSGLARWMLSVPDRATSGFFNAGVTLLRTSLPVPLLNDQVRMLTNALGLIAALQYGEANIYRVLTTYDGNDCFVNFLGSVAGLAKADSDYLAEIAKPDHPVRSIFRSLNGYLKQVNPLDAAKATGSMQTMEASDVVADTPPEKIDANRHREICLEVRQHLQACIEDRRVGVPAIIDSTDDVRNAWLSTINFESNPFESGCAVVERILQASFSTIDDDSIRPGASERLFNRMRTIDTNAHRFEDYFREVLASGVSFDLRQYEALQHPFAQVDYEIREIQGSIEGAFSHFGK